MRPGYLIAGWSDGGFHDMMSGTAAYIVQVRRNDEWSCLATGGTFDSATLDNESFRMEAIGLELMLDVVYSYIC